METSLFDESPSSLSEISRQDAKARRIRPVNAASGLALFCGGICGHGNMSHRCEPSRSIVKACRGLKFSPCRLSPRLGVLA